VESANALALAGRRLIAERSFIEKELEKYKESEDVKESVNIII